MKKTRIKINVPAISTRADAELAISDIALTVANKIRTTAKMDTEVVAVREKYQASLGMIEASIEAKTEALREWAEAHPEEFAKGRKSIEFVQGTIGFRAGTPALALLNKKWTWAKVVESMGAFLPHFLRSKPEVDKEALLAQRDEPLIQKTLPLVGLKVTQTETFFVEPKLTEVETRQVKEAA